VLSVEDRTEALRIARRAVERAVGPRGDEDPAEPFTTAPTSREFDERRGVFVTLKRYPDEELRGCIGYPLPVLPLREALPRAAAAAATQDPRFPPVRTGDLPRLLIEVSVLTEPVLLPSGRKDELLAAIEVGRDGLIVEGFGTSGLLLPQVAPEQGWNAEEFLDGTCEKAGLAPGAWRRPGVKVRRFSAEVFHERAPGDPTVEGAIGLTGTGAPPARRT
jgi:uncharacterized protein